MYLDILSNLVITKVHSASTMFNQENAKARRNCRSRWAVVMKYEGETIYTSEGKQFLSNRNHIILLPKGCAYSWLCTAAGHFSIIEFECPETHTEPLTFPLKNSEKLLKMFQDLEYKRNLKKSMTEMESIRDLYNILLALAPEAEPYAPSGKLESIAPAIRYISQNYNQKITNDALAARTGLSTVYFRKLFTQIMGIAPIAYVQELRIAKAKEMLRSEYTSLADLAQALGYNSLYHFSKMFKLHTGISPSEYAKGRVAK